MRISNMNNTVPIITLNDYFKPTMKINVIGPFLIGKNIKRVYNNILNIMADKTIDLLDKL
jgi:hypothetical protein